MFDIAFIDDIDSDFGSLGFAVDTEQLPSGMMSLSSRIGSQKRYGRQRMVPYGGPGPAKMPQKTTSQKGYSGGFSVINVGGVQPDVKVFGGGCSACGMKGFGSGLGPIGRDYDPTTWAYNIGQIDKFRAAADGAADNIILLRNQIWTLGKVVADPSVIPDPKLWDVWAKSFPKLGEAANKARDAVNTYKTARSQIETKLLLAKTWYDGYVVWLIKEDYKIKATALADIYTSLRAGLDDAMAARHAQSADWRNQGINFPVRTWFKHVFSTENMTRLAKTIKEDVAQAAKTGAEVLKAGGEIVGAPIAAFTWEMVKTPLLIAGGIVGAILLFKVLGKRAAPTPPPTAP